MFTSKKVNLNKYIKPDVDILTRMLQLEAPLSLDFTE
jgi:hypothetical protein